MEVENDDWAKDARTKTNISERGLPRACRNFGVYDPKKWVTSICL
jgi:hypothetical protein